jgi:membrane protease YdiL (CAAX protease family)
VRDRAAPRLVVVPQPQPPAAPQSGEPPGFWWRVLAPAAAVLTALVALVIVAGVLAAAGVGDDALAAIATAVAALVVLVVALALIRRLPAHERRLALGRRPGAIRAGLLTGLGVLALSASIMAAGTAIDPVARRRLEGLSPDLGDAPWQIALLLVSLVVLAPLGEELLFRALMLRGLVRRLAFMPAALVSSVAFAGAHADAYLVWPRALALVVIGVALAWTYRRHGYWASVTAHATNNAVAAGALLVTG